MARLATRKESQPLLKVVHEGVHTPITFLIVFFCLAAGVLVTAGASAETARQVEDWKALEQRWNSLIAERRHPDSTKWNTLETDLRAFAKKYDLHLEEHAKKAKPGPASAPPEAAFTECPARDDVPGYSGYLFPGPKGVCRYVCVPSEKK